MEKLIDMKILGVRWKSNNPHGACKKCAALHGKEFYYKPKDGQLSMDQLPQLPVHPNCRCTTIPIKDAKVLPSETNEHKPLPEELQVPEHWNRSLKPYMHDQAHVGVAGLIFRDDSYYKTPIWGKYCGEGWTAGRDVRDKIRRPLGDRSSEDSLDKACEEHDNCYDRSDTLPCDKALLQRLKALGPDPAKWPYPPASEEEYVYAERYRLAAIAAFTYQIAKARLFQRKSSYKGESFPLVN